MDDAAYDQAEDSRDSQEEATESQEAFDRDTGHVHVDVQEVDTRGEVKYPEIKGFEDCEFMSEREIRESLDSLPESQRRQVAENVGRINYVDEAPENGEGRRVYGRTYELEDGRKLGIDIYRHDDKEAAMHTVYHECGHVQYANLTPEKQEGWYRLYQGGGEEEQISQGVIRGYEPQERPEEDFCETYAYYRNAPERVARRSPSKYIFMKSHVYEGRIYMNQVDESRILYGRRRA